MSRLVVPRTNASLIDGDWREAPPDKYVDRLLKYIPVEIVGVYIAADSLIKGRLGLNSLPEGVPEVASADPVAMYSAIFLVVLGFIFTPIYLYRSRIDDQPWVLNATLGTISFVLWAYATGGSAFILLGVHDSLVAALCAPIFSLVAGAFEPKVSGGN